MKLKITKDYLIKSLEGLVGTRPENQKNIEKYLNEITGFECKMQLRSTLDEEEESYDHNLLWNMENRYGEYCYVDIYYINDNVGRLYITEVGYDFNI